MPRVKDVLTLKQMCITVAVKNFDRMWGRHFDKQFGDLPRLLYVISPFAELPSQLCENILQTLIDQRLLQKSQLQLLLVPQIRSISFAASCANSVLTQGLDLLTIRCKNLVDLNLTKCLSLSSKSVIQCISALPLLKTLILRQCKMGDDVMKVIALSLSHLIRLDLHACPITNRGAMLFCGDKGDFDPVCKALTWLDISATKIELSGCSTIIKSYTGLRYLSYPDSVEAVAHLHTKKTHLVNHTNGKIGSKHSDVPGTSLGQSVSDRNALDIHKLEILNATALRCSKIHSDSVYLACRHCPNVREVYWLQDVTDEGLKHLSFLKHLCVLEVTGDKPHSVSFHGGLLPLLRKQGQEMVALALHEIEGTDLGLLGHLCPQLQRLEVVCLFEETVFAQSHLTDQEQAASFRTLRKLTLVFTAVHFQFDPSDLLMVLVRAEALQELCLISVPGLSDTMFGMALSAHGFPRLKQVKIDSCDEITIESVKQLVTSCDLLNNISTCHCSQISYQDFLDVRNYIRKSGLDLIIDYK